jgi:hypothetical protein
MTDVSPSDDELVSSYLDHEATPAEVARVDGDPRLMARVEQMRAAVSLVATPPPLPLADLDRIRATAIAAFSPVAAAPVVDMAAARARRLERRNRVLAVAAAVVLFGGLIGGIGALSGGSDDDTAGDAADDSADDASSDGGDTDSGLDAMSASTNDDVEMEMAEAGMAAEADMADESAPIDDTAGDDSSDADDTASDDSASDDSASDDSASEEVAPLNRLQKSLSFDPLPDDLGSHTSVEELAAVVEAMVIEMVVDEESDFTPEDFLPFSPCEETLAGALEGDEVLDVDTAGAMVDATSYTIVVGRHFNTGELVGRLAPTATCSPATELFVDP